MLLRETESVPLPSSVDEHPFFRSLLGISGPGGNPIVGKIAEGGLHAQAAFLTLAAQAYAGFSIAAPLAFRRVAELSVDAQARGTAQRLFDVEMGRDPLVGAPGVSHVESFLRMVESLLPGLALARHDVDEYALHRGLRINQASLLDALALCEEIEIAGRGVTLAWQDLVSQWQVFLGIRTEKIERAFLDEHSLVEGGAVGLRAKVLAPYKDIRASDEYKQAREKARAAFVAHFDGATRAILKLVE